RGGNAAVPRLGEEAARHAGFRRLSRRLRFSLRLLVPDPLRRREPVFVLRARRQDLRHGDAEEGISRVGEAQHAEALVRRSAALARRSRRRDRAGGAFLQYAEGECRMSAGISPRFIAAGLQACSDMSRVSQPRDRLYPESDGKPMAETDIHRDWMVCIIERLKWRYRRKRVYVSG